jgi:putative ABC transport system substrate-binding protein
MNRRAFIAGLGSAAAWPVVARAQQPAMPVIGILAIGSPQSDAYRMSALRHGLSDVGYAEGQNVAIEYRWTENQPDRLPELAVDLARLKVSLIAAIGLTPAVLAAKAATTTIPVVFAIGGDPIKFGLVTSLNRPERNLTGVTFLVSTLVSKQLELLRETVPNAKAVGFLANRDNPNAESERRELLSAIEGTGGRLIAAPVGRGESDMQSAFAKLEQEGVDALCVEGDYFLLSSADQVVNLAAHYSLPTIYSARDFVSKGGLLSYGSSRGEAYRLMGSYAGRILKGEKPADLPVQRSVKVELALNLKTAKSLGITFPLSLIGRADEVIE